MSVEWRELGHHGGRFAFIIGSWLYVYREVDFDRVRRWVGVLSGQAGSGPAA